MQRPMLGTFKASLVTPRLAYSLWSELPVSLLQEMLSSLPPQAGQKSGGGMVIETFPRPLESQPASPCLLCHCIRFHSSLNSHYRAEPTQNSRFQCYSVTLIDISFIRPLPAAGLFFILITWTYSHYEPLAAMQSVFYLRAS